MPSGWRTGHHPDQVVTVKLDESVIAVHYRSCRDGSFRIGVTNGDDAEAIAVIYAWSPTSIDAEIAGRRVRATITVFGASLVLNDGAGDIELEVLPRFTRPGAVAHRGGLNAPMPGRVIAVQIAVGDSVVVGELLMVLEAMKMEHRITAAEAGVVTAVLVGVGDQVTRGEALLVVDA